MNRGVPLTCELYGGSENARRVECEKAALPPETVVARNSTSQTNPSASRHNGSTMDTQDLQDEELMALAREWRQRALRGEKDARGLAHELERAVRQRFGSSQNEVLRPLPLVGRLAVLQQTPERRWKLW